MAYSSPVCIIRIDFAFRNKIERVENSALCAIFIFMGRDNFYQANFCILESYLIHSVA